MTRDETKKILMSVQAMYPLYKPDDKTVTIEVWHRMLANEPYQLVDTALQLYVREDTKGYPPSIGQIFDRIRRIQALHTPQEDTLTDLEAWALVAKALKNSGYEAKEEFRKLPPVVQKILGSHDTLRDWAMLDSDEVHTVVQSNFCRAYRTMIQREKEQSSTAETIQRLAQGAKVELQALFAPMPTIGDGENCEKCP